MSTQPEPAIVIAFTTLDDAEGALDWIGLDFSEGDGCFDGELDEDAAELLDEACADADTPDPVRALAVTLRDQWRKAGAAKTWRVTFPA